MPWAFGVFRLHLDHLFQLGDGVGVVAGGVVGVCGLDVVGGGVGGLGGGRRGSGGWLWCGRGRRGGWLWFAATGAGEERQADDQDEQQGDSVAWPTRVEHGSSPSSID